MCFAYFVTFIRTLVWYYYLQIACLKSCLRPPSEFMVEEILHLGNSQLTVHSIPPAPYYYYSLG